MNSEELFKVAMSYCKESMYHLVRVEFTSPRVAHLFLARGCDDLHVLTIYPSKLEKLKETYL